MAKEKVRPAMCMHCLEPVQVRAVGLGWRKYNPDGTEHVCKATSGGM
jgi:hypothetical protein